MCPFKDLGHEDIVAEFNKLQQIGSTSDYQDKFDELRALMLGRTRQLPEDYFVSSFSSGLKEEITEVQMFQLRTLTEAITLARRKSLRLKHPKREE